MPFSAKRVAVVLSALLLAPACVTTTPEERARMERTAAVPVTRSTPDECDALWGAAVHWVTQQSRWKIQSQSDVMLQTYGLRDTTKVAFRLNRIPTGSGGCRVVLGTSCGNIFGCVPTELSFRVGFVRAFSSSRGF